MELNEDLFDITFLAITLILATLAFLRGLVREVFSVLNWILAIFLTYGSVPVINMLINKSDSSSLIGMLVYQTIAFIVFFIIVSMITSTISKPLSSVMPFVINQPLGLVFGVIKAYLIVALIFSVIVTIYSYNILPLPKSNRAVEGRVGPDWLQNSMSYEILEVGAEFLQPVVDSALSSLKNVTVKDKIKNKSTIGSQIMEKLDELEDREDQEDSDEYNQDEGYDLDNLQEMQDLIEQIGK